MIDDTGKGKLREEQRPDIRFVRLSEKHMPLLRSWYREGEGEQHLGGWDYASSLLDLQQRFTNRRCFIAFHGSVPRGIIDLEVNDDGTAWMSLLVDPSRRSLGMGKAILRVFLDHPTLVNVRELRAEVEHDNVASTRCFEGVGFVRRDDPSTTEGYILLVHEKS